MRHAEACWAEVGQNQVVGHQRHLASIHRSKLRKCGVRAWELLLARGGSGGGSSSSRRSS